MSATTKQTATDADTPTTAPKTCTFGTPKADLSASGGCCGEKKVCEDALRERAYLKWEAAGYPPGDGADFWLQAEAELLAEEETA